MKTYILSVPDEANDPAVRAALADLLAQRLIVLQTDEAEAMPPLSEAAFAANVRAALTSPVLAATEARAYLGL